MKWRSESISWLSGGNIPGWGTCTCRGPLCSGCLPCAHLSQLQCYTDLYLSSLVSCSHHKSRERVLLLLMLTPQLLTLNNKRVEWTKGSKEKRKREMKKEKRAQCSRAETAVTESQEALGPSSYQPLTSWLSLLNISTFFYKIRVGLDLKCKYFSEH